jgi:uncharacterized protein VirK/YbjX
MLVHFLRCVAHAPTFFDWFNNPAHASLREAIALRPSLVTRFLHPYLNADWTAARKLGVISGHYALIQGEFPFMRFMPSSGIVLAGVGEGIAIRLDSSARFEHEGELALNLYRGDLRLFSLAFTLGTLGSQRIAYAGGLQGSSGPDSLETYRAMTHRMHGLRPRELLISAFRAFCRNLAVERILGISDRQRVCSRPYFPTNGQVFSSYDSAWIENGARPRCDGFFELSSIDTRRTAAEAPSRKRALYRRRYAMVDTMSDQIGIALQQARRTTARGAEREPGYGQLIRGPK